MNSNPARKSRLTGLAVRKKAWDLEELREKQRLALEAFGSAEKVVHEMADDIEQTEQRLSHAMTGQFPLNLAQIESTRTYIKEQHTKHRQFLAKLRRAALVAEQADVQVKHAALAVRALGKIKQSADSELGIIVEKELLDQNMELWLQRALGENDDKY